MDENNTNETTELNIEEVSSTSTDSGYQFDADNSNNEPNLEQPTTINRILVQTQRPSSIAMPSNQGSTSTATTSTVQKEEKKEPETSKQNLDNVVIKNFSPTGFYDEKPNNSPEPSSSPLSPLDSPENFTYGANVVESTSLVDGGFQPTIELKETPFVSPQKKMKSQEVILLMAIMACMVVAIFLFGARALTTKPKAAPVEKIPFKDRPVASSDLQIITADRSFNENDYDKLFYDAYFKGIDGTLKVPRKEYKVYQKIDDSYFEIDINPEKWFYTKYMGPVSAQGTMLFVLATDTRFNEINIRLIPDETAQKFADQDNADVYEVNGWTFVYAEDRSILGFYPLTDKTDFCYYFANQDLNDNALYNFFDCLTTNIDFSEIDKEDFGKARIEVFEETEKKSSNKTNLKINNTLLLQGYNPNTHIVSWTSEPAYNIVKMRVNDLSGITFSVYELDDPLSESNLASYGIASVEESSYRNISYFIAKDSSGKIIGVYIPDVQSNSKQCYVAIDSTEQEFDYEKVFSALVSNIITIK